jgi:anti-sigma B factor antagonist
VRVRHEASPPTRDAESCQMTASFLVDADKLSCGIHELRVQGELDQATVPDLEVPLAAAIESDADAILVNLTNCEFIDSTGLGLLVNARDRVTIDNGRQFGVCCPHAQVRRLLEITGIDQAVDLHETRDAALESLRR